MRDVKSQLKVKMNSSQALDLLAGSPRKNIRRNVFSVYFKSKNREDNQSNFGSGSGDVQKQENLNFHESESESSQISI